MKCFLCDQCGLTMSAPYCDVFVCQPKSASGQSVVVSEFHFCKKCMIEGFAVREKAEPKKTPLLPPGNPNGLN